MTEEGGVVDHLLGGGAHVPTVLLVVDRRVVTIGEGLAGHRGSGHGAALKETWLTM